MLVSYSHNKYTKWRDTGLSASNFWGLLAFAVITLFRQQDNEAAPSWESSNPLFHSKTSFCTVFCSLLFCSCIQCAWPCSVFSRLCSFEKVGTYRWNQLSCFDKILFSIASKLVSKGLKTRYWNSLITWSTATGGGRKGESTFMKDILFSSANYMHHRKAMGAGIALPSVTGLSCYGKSCSTHHVDWVMLFISSLSTMAFGEKGTLGRRWVPPNVIAGKVISPQREAILAALLE